MTTILYLMKILILSFVLLSNGFQIIALNNSSISVSRFKRGYTRWKGENDKLTSPEFLVHIYDDDIRSAVPASRINDVNNVSIIANYDAINNFPINMNNVLVGVNNLHNSENNIPTDDKMRKRQLDGLLIPIPTKSIEYTRFAPQKPDAEVAKRSERDHKYNSQKNRKVIGGGTYRFKDSSNEVNLLTQNFAKVPKRPHTDRDGSPSAGLKKSIASQNVDQLNSVSSKVPFVDSKDLSMSIDENDDEDFNILQIEVDKPTHMIGESLVDINRYTIVPSRSNYHSPTSKSIGSTNMKSLIKTEPKKLSHHESKFEINFNIQNPKTNIYRNSNVEKGLQLDGGSNFLMHDKGNGRDEDVYDEKDEGDASDDGLLIQDVDTTVAAKLEFTKSSSHAPNFRVFNPDYYEDADFIAKNQILNIADDNVPVNTTECVQPTRSAYTITTQVIAPVPRDHCDIVVLNTFTFLAHHKLPEIVAQLRKWVDNSPVAKWVDVTEGNLTHMENPIHMMIVDDRSRGQDHFAKESIMVVAGIQGRDYHAVSAAMFLLYELIERGEYHADLLGRFRFWIIPVFNPDGYEYSTTFPEAREWNKNMRQRWETSETCEKYGMNCLIRNCLGVNLDRNFEYQWILEAKEKQSVDPCNDLFAGTRQLSEPETKALTQYLHNAHARPHTFVAFKEGDVLGVMYPYSHTRKLQAFDKEYRTRARYAADAASSITGRKYVFGQVSEFLPLYAGGIEDWMAGHLGVDNAYTIMLQSPRYTSNISIGEVAFEGFAALETLLIARPNVALVSRQNAHAHSDATTLRPPLRALVDMWHNLGTILRHSCSYLLTVVHILICYLYVKIFFILLPLLINISCMP